MSHPKRISVVSGGFDPIPQATFPTSKMQQITEIT